MRRECLHALSDTSVTGNTSGGDGGGIYNYGVARGGLAVIATLTNDSVNANFAAANGGGIDNESARSLVIDSTTSVSDNKAQGRRRRPRGRGHGRTQRPHGARQRSRPAHRPPASGSTAARLAGSRALLPQRGAGRLQARPGGPCHGGARGAGKRGVRRKKEDYEYRLMTSRIRPTQSRVGPKWATTASSSRR